MRTDFDAIVLGGGPAGEHCAARLAAGGARVAIAERELLGGEAVDFSPRSHVRSWHSALYITSST